MLNSEKNFSDSKIATPPSPEEDDHDRESLLHVCGIRVFFENSDEDELSKQWNGDTDLNQLFHEKAKKITIDSITENKLTLKLFLDEDQEENSNLLNPEPTATKPNKIENKKDILGNSNLFSFESGDETLHEKQKSFRVTKSVFVSVSTQTENETCSKETQCDIIGDKKFPQDNFKSQEFEEKVALNACNCKLLPGTSARVQRLMSFYLVQGDNVYNKCIFREIGTQTEDIKAPDNIESTSHFFDCPLATAKAGHVNLENESWINSLNESLKIEEYFKKSKFDKVFGDGIIFNNFSSQDRSNDEDQDLYLPEYDPEIGESDHANIEQDKIIEIGESDHANIDQDKISLYFESRLEQRKGKAKIKHRRFPPLSSIEKNISSCIKNRFLEDEPNLKIPQPMQEHIFHNAHIEKKFFPVQKLTFISPPKQRKSSFEVLTLSYSKSYSRKICTILKFPTYFNHFLSVEDFKIRPLQKISINPTLFSEIILQYPSASEILKLVKLKAHEESITNFCLKVKKEDGSIRRGTVHRNLHLEVESDNDFSKYKVDISHHSPAFESCCFNSSTVPNLIFHRKLGITPTNKHTTCLPLCDSCFDLIQKAVKDDLEKDSSKENSYIKGLTSKFETELNVQGENSHLKNKESTPEDNEMIVLSLAKRLKEDSMNEHCAIVNNYLLNMGSSDPNELKTSVKYVRRQWLKEVGNKTSNIEVIRFLIAYFQAFSDNLLKMIVYTTDITGNNVLHFAFSNNRFDIAELFLTNSYAKDLLTMKNKAGHTAFMVCSISNPKTEMDWFIVYKAVRQVDFNQVSNNNGQTPLMNAAHYGSDLMVKLLIDAGANPNIQDIDGSTALMYAAEYGHEKCVEILLSNPLCDPNIKDNDEETACSIALSAGHKDLALLIYLRTKNRSTLCARFDSLGNSKNMDKCRRILRASSLNHL